MAEQRQEKKKWLSGKVDSREDAIKIARDASVGLFGLSFFNVVLFLLFGVSSIFDAVLYLASGFLVRRFYSRTAAITVLVFALAMFVMTLMNRAGMNIAGGGKNIMLAVFGVVIAVRATEATVKFQGKYSLKNEQGDPPIT